MSEEELSELERLGTVVLSRVEGPDVARFGELLRAAVGTLRSVRSASLRPSPFAWYASEAPTSRGTRNG